MARKESRSENPNGSCTTKCCEKGRAYRCKFLLLNSRNKLLTDTIIFNGFVILCTAYMMACSVVAGHVTAILCHSGAELFYHDLHAALSRPPFVAKKQQASISLSFSLSRRFPNLGIASTYRAKLRPDFLYITKARTHLRPGF